jgi:hypothetical protein
LSRGRVVNPTINKETVVKPKKEPVQITARLEILDAVEDDRVERDTVVLSPAEKVALEAEKARLLAEVRAPRLDDSPRARRLGRTRPEGVVDPDAPGVEAVDDTPVVATEDELRSRAKAKMGLTPGRASRAPETVDIGDADDVSPERRQLDLSPDEIAQLEAEKQALVASIRASRPTEADVADAVPVVEGDIEIPSSPELEAAAAAVAEVNAEIAAFEAERKANEKRRIEEEKAAKLAHEARVAGLKAKHDAAEAVRQQALQKQASVELKLRAEKARQAAARELERRARVQSDLNEQLRARVQPVLDGCRTELAELEQFAKDNEDTLASLWKQNWKSCPATWPMDLRLEFQREVSGKAYQLFMDLRRSLDAYPRHIKTLEDIIRDGHDEGREGFIVQSLYEASISRPGTGDGNAASLRRDLARLNEVAAEVYDKGAYAESLGVVHAVEEPAISKEDQETVKERLLGRGEPTEPTRAVLHHGEESSATIEDYLQRVDGAVRQA